MKITALVLVVALVLAVFPVGVQANVTPISTLNSVEEMLYGEVQKGSLIERIEQVERDIFGEVQSGAVLVRIDRVNSFLARNDSGGTSLKLQLNLAEWGFLAKLTDGQPLVKRLDSLETDIYGAPQTGPIAERTKNVMTMIWGTTNLNIRELEVKEQTLVKIRLLDEADSGKNRVGDRLRYRVVEDVIVDGRIVVPAGAEGTAVVSEVESAGRLGRDGKLVLDFGSIASLDGTHIPLRVDETATEKNRSLELAAGASMAGVLLLGPIGLAGGYFVRGRDVQIAVGTEFFVETARTVKANGFLLRPADR